MHLEGSKFLGNFDSVGGLVTCGLGDFQTANGASFVLSRTMFTHKFCEVL